ncbi:hypothetical protein GF312_03205 [Candidatus Poribacteria bacterium]|nr:hypothetical protein [Candidatus Poribacteria bacterium]
MNKYRVGVIGCGGIGTRHASGLVGLENAEFVAACDISEKTLNSFNDRWADTWPNISLYNDYREMLDKENLDVVTVATPDHLHTEPVVDSANSGVKGIFCEKPMATSLEDADRMMQAVEKNKTILSIDHTRRWQPLWRHIKEDLVNGGNIGELKYIVGTLSGRRASIFRNGTHLIDAMIYIAQSEPEWVFAELEEGYEDYVEYKGDGGYDPTLEPSASGYIHFKNGVRGFYTGTSKQTPAPKWRFEVVGSEAYINVSDEPVIYRKGKPEPIIPPVWDVEGIPAGAQELIELIDVGGEPQSPAIDAYNVVQVIFGFFESQQKGNVRVNLPLSR